MSKTNQDLFGFRLAEKRKKLGLTQKGLASACGVSVTSVQNYENGQVPGGEVLLRLSSALNCSMEWLLTGEGPMFLGGTKIATPKQALDLAKGRIPRDDSLTEDEAAPREMGGLDREHVRMAIEAVEEGLKATNRELPPEKKAALVLAAYDLIEESGTTEKVIELIRIVA